MNFLMVSVLLGVIGIEVDATSPTPQSFEGTVASALQGEKGAGAYQLIRTTAGISFRILLPTYAYPLTLYVGDSVRVENYPISKTPKQLYPREGLKKLVVKRGDELRWAWVDDNKEGAISSLSYRFEENDKCLELGYALVVKTNNAKHQLCPNESKDILLGNALYSIVNNQSGDIPKIGSHCVNGHCTSFFTGIPRISFLLFRKY